jgi:hypothetical protein
METFFDSPILNSPYGYPGRHWELDQDGLPTSVILESRRRSDLITPVPKPKKRKATKGQAEMTLGADDGITTAEQEYNPTPIINELRGLVDAWRALPNPRDWQVTPTTARLLQHWRHHGYQGIRPFFCQVEAVETAIWLADPLNLIVEIKGYRGEDAIEKANTMRAYWVPGVNNLGSFGRWAFAEFTEVFEIEAEFGKLIGGLTDGGAAFG